MLGKQPKIRLKKTDLPMTADVSRSLAVGHRSQVFRDLESAHNPLFYIGGNRIPGVTPKQINDFKDSRFTANGLAFRGAHFKQMFLKLLNISSLVAPWTWDIEPGLAGRSASDQDVVDSLPNIWDWSENEFIWKFVLPDITFDASMTDLTPKERSVRLQKSRIYRIIRRYTHTVNRKCIREGLPIQFVTAISLSEVDRDTGSYHVLAVRMLRQMAWVRTEKEYKTHLRTDPQTFLPAHFLPEESLKSLRAEYEFKTEDSKLVYVDLGSNLTHIRAPYFQGKDTPPSTWLNALIQGETASAQDVLDQRAAIPPQAEAVTCMTLLDHIEDLKQITRTFMRISQPYDHLSFFPVDP